MPPRSSSAANLRGVGTPLILFVAGLIACGEQTPAARPVEQRAEQVTVAAGTIGREPLGALPEAPKLDPKIVALGRRLFHEPRLSVDDKVACSSCHDLANGGDDGRARPVGVGGKLGLVNAPTVYNAALNFVQFWDGRAATLEDQINGPLTNPLEMGSNWEQVVEKLRRDATYASAFAAAYPDGLTSDNVRRSIADFERTLITRGSAFDRWLEGDEAALSSQARTGYETFKAVGCIACHQGQNVGGNMFQRFGVLGDYFKDRGAVTDADYGRYNVTHDEADRYVFRVPSLRNVEYTGPYFHDASAATLPAAVQVMARYQLGRKLSPEQLDAIIAFLKSLSSPMAAAGVNG
ncbi:MAG TPA: cytochrome-c peroxidase [Polyangiales bacterium]|nr:cytochrome-c peroxidase [Polyangiales bacterium]